MFDIDVDIVLYHYTLRDRGAPGLIDKSPRAPGNEL